VGYDDLLKTAGELMKNDLVTCRRVWYTYLRIEWQTYWNLYLRILRSKREGGGNLSVASLDFGMCFEILLV
jgi:hypothetical protein